MTIFLLGGILFVVPRVWVQSITFCLKVQSYGHFQIFKYYLLASFLTVLRYFLVLFLNKLKSSTLLNMMNPSRKIRYFGMPQKSKYSYVTWLKAKIYCYQSKIVKFQLTIKLLISVNICWIILYRCLEKHSLRKIINAATQRKSPLGSMKTVKMHKKILLERETRFKSIKRMQTDASLRKIAPSITD